MFDWLKKMVKFVWEYVRRIFVIVITGGPGGGKSSVLSMVSQCLTKLGFIVIIGEEIVTRNVYSGFSPMDFDTETYQRLLIKQMLDREEVYREVAEYMLNKYNKPVVIFYDRALFDNLAYMPEDMFEKILAEFGLTPELARTRYDAVIHMMTPAIGAEDAYTTENNKARTEGLKEARELDIKTRNAWMKSPNFVVIDNSTGFKEKVDRFFDAVYRILGIPVPTDEKRVFLVEKPDTANIESVEGVTKMKVYQTYLPSNDLDVEVRICEKSANGSSAYFYTEKKLQANGQYEEKSRILNVREYQSYLKNGVKSFSMTRYCFQYEEQFCELDIYDGREDAVLEITPTEAVFVVDIPACMAVKKEITSNPEYERVHFAN